MRPPATPGPRPRTVPRRSPSRSSRSRGYRRVQPRPAPLGFPAPDSTAAGAPAREGGDVADALEVEEQAVAGEAATELDRRLQLEAQRLHHARALGAVDPGQAVAGGALGTLGDVVGPSLEDGELSRLEPVGPASHADVELHPVPQLLDHPAVDAAGTLEGAGLGLGH